MDQQAPVPTVETAPARDARVRLVANHGHMTVELLVEPPENGGLDVTLDDLKAALAREGIVYGVDEAALAELTLPPYNRPVVVARGTPAADGTDGTCTERFARSRERQQQQRQDGSVDYKELGFVNEVAAGTVLCDITPPTKGEDGTNTKGKPLKARDGARAIPPLGEGTRLSEDGLHAKAAVAGNLVFRDGRFVVETLVRVHNVDYEVGNITFGGDVLVDGDVMDGFEVHAGGTVTLRGQAGAVVIQAGDLVVEKGINGTGRAVLEAERTIKAGFLENCTLRAGTSISASSIINCQVECEGDVDVTGGKGIICGGKITAYGSVKAKEVGNDFNTPTVVVLGVTPRLLKERKRAAGQLDDVSAHIEELAKNVNYIEELVTAGRPVPPERVQMLKRAQVQLPMSERKKEQLENILAELDAKMEDVKGSTLTARLIYPPTRVSIGRTSGNVADKRSNCRVFVSSEGELVFGSA